MGAEAIGTTFLHDISGHRRFEFGRNWRRFLSLLNDERIEQAQRSLTKWLDVEHLRDRRFLDIGCGSGLFSLAALMLGAQVHSFDYDPQSVECARILRTRYFPGKESEWTIERGDILDRDYIMGLGPFDIIYAWGVLHHTGDLWCALENASIPVEPHGGLLHLAIYNDQGSASRRWAAIKRLYTSGLAARIAISGTIIPYWICRGLVGDLVRLRNPLTRYREYGSARGMARTTDWFDWLGGYPFEVAKPEQVFDFYRSRGFRLERLRTANGGLGNNEFLLRRE
jgi:2-polyprenyl-3-methyl-5-hydroxy-6-metoxy-1,4-benzoquinol methylase